MEHSSGSSVKFSAKKGEPSLVPPAQDTENGLYFLSNLDQIITWMVPTIYCFKSDEKGNKDAGEVIKNALRKVLVHYYPLAGRLAISSEGRLIVHCTGEGAVFVEAEANCRMEEIGDMAEPDTETLEKLVYNIPGAKSILEIPPLIAQVTKFTCGGFVLGMGVSHCIVDGIAAMEFVNSWGEIARGLSPTVSPFLDRSILKARNPPKIEYLHREFDEIKDISRTDGLYGEKTLLKSVCFDPEKIQKLKMKAMEDGILEKCTTFEVISAFVWRARAKALELCPDQQTKLMVIVNGRPKFNPPLPKWYFGNGIVHTCSVCTAAELLEKPLSFATGLVQEAIKMVTDSYMRSAIDCFEVKRTWPSLASTLVITTWSRLSIYTIDFGWGEPILLAPGGSTRKEMVYLLSHGNDMKSINVLLELPTSAMNTFEELIEM